MPLLISGLDFKTKVIPVNGNEESIQIWDTAGQERFRSITQSYFRKVDGIILVYDITHEESFLNLQSWVSCIQVDMGWVNYYRVPVLFINLCHILMLKCVMLKCVMLKIWNFLPTPIHCRQLFSRIYLVSSRDVNILWLRDTLHFILYSTI